MNRKNVVVLAFASAVLLTGCGGSKHEESHDHHHSDSTAETSAPSPAGGAQFTVDAAFQTQLSEVFTSYIALKDAFITSDPGKVKTEAGVVQQSLGKTDMKLLTGAAHHDWMTFLEGMQASLKEIEGSGDIEIQRAAFAKVSDNLYKSIKAYGIGGTTAYYEFCPMAFNNQGGFWLSNEEKIRNPYFGDKMLTCGSVKEKL